MPDILLHCEPDGSYASIEVSSQCRRAVTILELYEQLRQRMVVFGIDEHALQSIAVGARRGERVIVATCKAVENGLPGSVEWLIDLSKTGKPRELQDGKVNLRDLQIDVNVLKGDKIVLCKPPVPGKPGISIHGTPIPVPDIEKNRIVAGFGTEYLTEQNDYIVAARDGAVVVNGDTIEVHNRKTIQGDVDYATGNVSFNGDLKITGSVRSGFSVSASGDITVSGSIEDADIQGGGSVVIRGGAIGSGNGVIVCGGSLSVHHATQFQLSAEGDITVQEDTLHSTMLSEGTIRAKTIIGGTITAFSVNAQAVGSTAEARTVIDVTRIAQLLKERYNLLKQFGVLASRRTELYQEMFTLVRDGMDDKGFLPLNHRESLESLKQNTLQSVKTESKIQRRIEKIDEIEKAREGGASVTIGVVYPNTIIRIGNEERLIRELQKKLFITSA